MGKSSGGGGTGGDNDPGGLTGAGDPDNPNTLSGQS
jgi:hypothetical protein